MNKNNKVTSEVIIENDCNKPDNRNQEKYSITNFYFKLPSYMIEEDNTNENELKYDEDGDLILNRKNKEGLIVIEHSSSTELKLVGLQIWRGAFLLADFILSNPSIFKNKIILELGSGVGFDSIVAGMLADEVICTDVNFGGILNLININFEKNKKLIKSKYNICELNFLNDSWKNCKLKNLINDADIIMAADVIYDNGITEGFVKTLDKLLNTNNANKKTKTIFVALEKRYVFTIDDLDTIAPMYEEFLNYTKRYNWNIEYINTNFKQYFQYQRLKQLILLKITKN